MLEENLRNTQEELKKIQEIVKTLSNKGSLDEITENMPAKEQIDLNMNLAYTLSSLYYSYLKLNQVDTSKHQIKNEIIRIQAAFQKYMPIEKANEEPKMQLNKDAAKRLIQPNLKQLDKDENYKKKQQKLIQEDKDFTNRFEQPKDLWADEDKKEEKNKQKLVRGNLIPQTGHLKWKDEIDKIMKKQI